MTNRESGGVEDVAKLLCATYGADFSMCCPDEDHGTLYLTSDDDGNYFCQEHEENSPSLVRTSEVMQERLSQIIRSERALSDQRVAQERARSDARVAAVVNGVKNASVNAPYTEAIKQHDVDVTAAIQADSDFIRLNP